MISAEGGWMGSPTMARVPVHISSVRNERLETKVRERLANPYRMNSRRDVLLENVLEVLKESNVSPVKRDYLFKLSPAEKYDLATGDYNFAGTRSILAITHNAAQWPAYWYGICNGMAVAAVAPRPYAPPLEPMLTPVRPPGPPACRLEYHRWLQMASEP